MAGLGATTLDLQRLRGRWSGLMAASRAAQAATQAPGARAGGTGRLTEVEGFGSNPGRLRMLTYVPEHLPPSPAMVVVLHGCTQDAAGYDLGAGWSTLAERHGFVVVCAEQPPRNNPKSCFNWFQPGDIARGGGEALSIREMVERAALDHGVDRTRIFVTGLSAGGAMAAVMLATYPEVFAGGGIVAGLPYGCAASVQDALKAMFEESDRPARALGDRVRGASGHRGPWPRVSIWHGSADTVVRPGNGTELVKQWTDVHGLALASGRRDAVDGFPRETWSDASGRAAVEFFAIDGMGHGTPLQVGTGDEHCGQAGPFLLDVGISSSLHMLRFWGLAEEAPDSAAAAGPAVPAPAPGGTMIVAPDGTVGTPREPDEILPPGRGQEGAAPPPKSSLQDQIQKVIQDSLKAAGLL